MYLRIEWVFRVQCSGPIWWKDVVESRNRMVECSTTSDYARKFFLQVFCESRNQRRVFSRSAAKKKPRPNDAPFYTLRIAAPLVFRNHLPVDVAVSVQVRTSKTCVCFSAFFMRYA